MKTLFTSQTGHYSLYLIEDIHLYVTEDVDRLLVMLALGKNSKTKTINERFGPLYDDVIKSNIISLEMWENIQQYLKTLRYEKTSDN